MRSSNDARRLAMPGARRMLFLLFLVSLVAVPATAWAPAASAAIEQGGATTGVNAQSGAGTLTIPKPAHVAAGDFLLAQVTFEKGADINNLVRPSTDWAPVRRTNSIDPATGTDLGQAIFYKVAGNAEPADYTWEFRSGSSLQQVRAAGGIIRYEGVNLLHPDGPILGSNGGAGDGIVLTAPGVNALEDAVVVAFFGHKKLTTLTDPVGMANVYQQEHSNQSGPTIRASEETRSADGATGDRISLADAVVGSDKWVAQLVALRSNTKPVYTAPDDQEADEGEDKAFALGSFVDPDNHPSWEVTVDWGDGTTPEVFTHTNTNPANPFAARDLGTRDHTYVDNQADDAPYTVTVTVDDGTDTDTDTFEIIVHNVAPSITKPADQTADEGTSKLFDLGSFTDPGADSPWTVIVDWGDGSPNTTFTEATAGDITDKSHPYADNGAYTVTLTVREEPGTALAPSDSETFTINVGNLRPTVTAAENQTASAGVAKSFALGSFSDLGVDDDPWAVNVDWGDGSADDNFNVNDQGDLPARSHTYASPGTFTVTVTVTDKDGGAGSATFQVTVTSAGFQFYLHNRSTQPSTSTTRLANLPMDSTEPTKTGALPNYDTDSDAFPGRLIQKNTPSPTQSGITLYQNWVSPAFASDFSITKVTNAQVKIWTAMKDNNTSKVGRIRVYIRDCPGTPQTGCVVIGAADYIRPAGGAFSEAAVSVPWTFTGTTHTVAAGRRLEVKIVVLDTSGDDMWVGYDTTSMPAWFKYPQP